MKRAYFCVTCSCLQLDVLGLYLPGRNFKPPSVPLLPRGYMRV